MQCNFWSLRRVGRQHPPVLWYTCVEALSPGRLLCKCVLDLDTFCIGSNYKLLLGLYNRFHIAVQDLAFAGHQALNMCMPLFSEHTMRHPVWACRMVKADIPSKINRKPVVAYINHEFYSILSGCRSGVHEGRVVSVLLRPEYAKACGFRSNFDTS